MKAIPEQRRDPAQVGEKADVCSFGVMLYQLLSAQLPFRTDSAAERFAMRRFQPPLAPRGEAEAFGSNTPERERFRAAARHCARDSGSAKVRLDQ